MRECLFSILRNISHKLEKVRQIFHFFSAQKNKDEKVLDVNFRVKCTIYETMDSLFGLGSEKWGTKN